MCIYRYRESFKREVERERRTHSVVCVRERGAMDLRQVMAGVLTFSMFMMMGNMIKRDHFDGAIVMNVPASSVQYDLFRVSRQSLVEVTAAGERHSSDERIELLKQCWNNPSQKAKEISKGYITFSLSGGAEYHVSQVADAVVVARYLGATLVLPDIIGTKPGKIRGMKWAETKEADYRTMVFGSFAEVYDVEKFVASMKGVIQVAKKKPPEGSGENPIVVRVPNGVSEDYVSSNVEPFFRKKGNLKIATYFPTINTRKAEANKIMNSFSCLAMFQSLHLEPKLQGVVNSMIERLKTLSSKMDGHFIAVDLRVDMLEKRDCQETGPNGMKTCYNPSDISQFLKKIGFPKETTVYLTQPGWHNSLDAIKKTFPNTYTKDDIMEDDMKKKYLSSKNFDYGSVIDFHICSQSDIFIPSTSGLFYTNVVGERIANGKSQVLVPAQVPSSSPRDYISSYIAKKNHLAYSCFC